MQHGSFLVCSCHFYSSNYVLQPCREGFCFFDLLDFHLKVQSFCGCHIFWASGDEIWLFCWLCKSFANLAKAEQFTISCYTIKWMEIKVQGARYVLYCQTSYTMPVIFNSKKSWRGEGWLFLETKWTFLIYWIWRAETEHKEI